jgi:LysM repeat protein
MEIYVVKPGDSLYSIALAHGVSLTLLAIDNDLPDDAELAVGQTLVIQYPHRPMPYSPGSRSSPSPPGTGRPSGGKAQQPPLTAATPSFPARR